MNIIRNLPKVVILLGLLAMVIGGAFLMACLPNVETQVEAQPDVNCSLPKEIETMEQTEHSVSPNPVIPPIDASAPTQKETATFSLG